MDERSAALSRYRLEKAENCLKSAHILTDAEEYYGAAYRSYYAIFHCVRAILALDGADFSKHSGVMAYFQRNYVKTGIFDKKYSKLKVCKLSIKRPLFWYFAGRYLNFTID